MAAKESEMPFDQSQEKWVPWNKGKLVGQKAPLKPQEVWSIRVRLQLADNKRDLALFNLAIDSKLRGCDLLRLRVSDLRMGGEIRSRAKIIQQKTGTTVQFEVTKQTRDAIEAWCAIKELRPTTGCFRAERTNHGISQPGNTLASSNTG
jgi:integrase